MRDTHLVAIDIHRAIQTLQMDHTVNLRERSGCDGIGQITLEIEKPACREQKGDDDHSN
jgi:hypothetical protein